MTATVHEATAHVGSPHPDIQLTYEGDYRGYYAACTACNWISDTFHAVGLEPWPKAAVLDDADEHNIQHHASTTDRKHTTS